MAVDFMNSRMGEQLKRATMLSDAEAWIQTMTPQLRITIVREWIQNDQLLSRGVDEDNNIIGIYSELTEILSGGRKRAGDPYNLFDTGDFFRSMFVTVLANQIIIDADFGKMQDQEWWREEILGLTDENMAKLIEETRRGYIKYLRRILGIN